jgi:hypothetical protein
VAKKAELKMNPNIEKTVTDLAVGIMWDHKKENTYLTTNPYLVNKIGMREIKRLAGLVEQVAKGSLPWPPKDK